MERQYLYNKYNVRRLLGIIFRNKILIITNKLKKKLTFYQEEQLKYD